jgi:hypothetical protein
MSEWLTTGQMIDQLKDGEIAKSTDGEYEAYWHNGLLEFRDRHGDVQETIIKSDQKRKWRILPKYVSFEEAKVAYENGKIIGLHNDNSERVTYFKKVNNEHLYSFNKENWSFFFASLTWREILEGKWTIED